MSRSTLVIICSFVSLVLSFILAAWLIPGGLELEIVLLKEKKTLFAFPLDPDERFTIHYYHSVENAPIWEEHSMDKTGRIYIEEERYEKFGAGMGKMPGVGRMVQRGIYEAVEDMHMPVGDFILRIGSPGVDHTIIWRGKRYNLSRIASHKAVQFSGRRVSMLYRLWRSFEFFSDKN